MKQSPKDKAFDGKKIRAKGKWFVRCYFEDCTLITDERTQFFECYFGNCHKTGRGVINTSIAI